MSRNTALPVSIDFRSKTFGTAAAPAYAEASRSLSTRLLTVEGGHVAYDDTGGDGQIVLAIPGMGDLRSQYRRLGPALKQAGYRVVTMDVRGHGESSARWNDYSAHAIGCDALALLSHLDAGPAILLGSSFAAGSVLWAAHDAPAQVAGVALLGPIVRDLEVAWIAKLALAIGFAGPWRVSFWTAYWNSLFPSLKPVDQKDVRASIARNMREEGRMDALRVMISLSKAETAAMLSHSRMPALVIMGTRDPDFPDATVEATWLATELRAEMLMVSGAGHYPQTEMPDIVLETLLRFIKGLRPRDA